MNHSCSVIVILCLLIGAEVYARTMGAAKIAGPGTIYVGVFSGAGAATTTKN